MDPSGEPVSAASIQIRQVKVQRPGSRSTGLVTASSVRACPDFVCLGGAFFESHVSLKNRNIFRKTTNPTEVQQVNTCTNTYVMMASESCRPSRLRYSRSLQLPMMLSRAGGGMVELDRSIWTSCKQLRTKDKRTHQVTEPLTSGRLARQGRCPSL